ncbi:MAG: tetratricopeptide repeat protein [Planctomycetota bacterium]|nr:tetratricopeptide repeat protein [Planctomycetota bacterium]
MKSSTDLSRLSILSGILLRVVGGSIVGGLFAVGCVAFASLVGGGIEPAMTSAIMVGLALFGPASMLMGRESPTLGNCSRTLALPLIATIVVVAARGYEASLIAHVPYYDDLLRFLSEPFGTLDTPSLALIAVVIAGLVATFLLQRNPIMSGAVVGLAIGAELSTYSGFPADRWYFAIIVGPAMGLIVYRTLVVAVSFRADLDPHSHRSPMSTGDKSEKFLVEWPILAIAMAAVSAILIALSHYGAGWISYAEPHVTQDYGTEIAFGRYLVSSIADFSEMFALPGGVFGLVGVLATFTVLSCTFVETVPWGVGVGLVIALIDWLIGGVVLTTLLASPERGAVVGAAIGVLTFAEYAEDRRRAVRQAVMLAIIAGCGVLLIRIETDWPTIITIGPAVGGGLALLFARVNSEKWIQSPVFLGGFGKNAWLAVSMLIIGCGVALSLRAVKAVSTIGVAVARMQDESDQANLLVLSRRLPEHPLPSICLLSGYIYERDRRSEDPVPSIRAAAYATSLIHRNPEHTTGYFLRANALIDGDRFGLAASDSTHVLEKDSKHFAARKIRANSLRQIDHFDAAMYDFDWLLNLDQEDFEARRGRGESLSGLERYDEALQELEKAIHLKPDDAQVYVSRGEVYGKQKKHEQAIHDLTRAIELNSDYSGAYNLRGWQRIRTNEYRAAVLDFTEAIRLKPTYANAYRGRASAHEKLEDTDRAAADRKRADQLEGKTESDEKPKK